MKIRNINVEDHHLVNKVLESSNFILDVVSQGIDLKHKMLDEMHRSRFHGSVTVNDVLPLLPSHPVWTLADEDDYQYNVATLIHTVPIYLFEKAEPVMNETGIVDFLGAYFSGKGSKSPFVVLFVNTMWDCCKEDKNAEQHFKWLLTKVLIHELSHAAMDVYNLEENYEFWRGGIRSITEKIPYNTEYGKWREESFANALTLNIIEKFGNQDFSDYARDFMLHQPAEYALGVQLKDVAPQYLHWRIREKTDGVCEVLQNAWLDYVKANHVTAEGLEDFEGKILFPRCYAYNGNLYTGYDDLVLTVIQDYLTAQPNQLSYADLCEVFPNVPAAFNNATRKYDDAYLDYDPSKVDDISYNTNNIVILSDRKIVVMSAWHTKELDGFIDRASKVGIEIKKYDNGL